MEFCITQNLFLYQLNNVVFDTENERTDEAQLPTFYVKFNVKLALFVLCALKREVRLNQYIHVVNKQLSQ